MLLPLRLSSHPFHYPLPRDTENWRKLPNISTQSMPEVMNPHLPHPFPEVCSCPKVSLTGSGTFLMHPQTTCPGVALPTMGQALPYQFNQEKAPTNLPAGRLDWHFLYWKSPFPDNSSLCQVDKKLTDTHDKYISCIHICKMKMKVKIHSTKHSTSGTRTP